MKRPKDKFKRIVKYWRVSYRQASGRERLSVGMFALVMLTYVWWAFLVL
jgi:hypothetical protein